MAYNFSFVAALAYDAVWTLAIALDKTARMEEGDITGTDCETMEGGLVDLDEFNYTNAQMGCLIRWNLEQTDFKGVSVSLRIFILHYIICYYFHWLNSLVYGDVAYSWADVHTFVMY